MKKIWDIKLYRTKSGFKVQIIDAEYGKKVESEAPTPHKAYLAAEKKLVMKPWLVSLDETKE